jgi:hypothetical protein
MAEQKIPDRNDPIWLTYAKRYPGVQDMIRRNQPLTREQWLINNYLLDEDGIPDPVPHETEMSMPPPFRQEEEDFDILPPQGPRR